MQKISIDQRLRLKFKPYKDRKFLVFINEIELKNLILKLFTALGVKNLSFPGNKDDLLYVARENLKEIPELQFLMGIIAYHADRPDNPAYIAGFLQSFNQVSKKRIFDMPFIAYAESDKIFEQQFGKTPAMRTKTIQAATKNGLKGLVIGKLDDSKTVKIIVEKIIEIIVNDELARMTPIERHIRKLINSAYVYLRKEMGGDEEKEQNLKAAISLFEEVLQLSKDNYDALLGKATACCKSSDPAKILEGTLLFAKLKESGEEREVAYEGHTASCYKMAKLEQDETKKQEWLLKGVNSLKNLIEWQLKEHKNMKDVLADFKDPELMKKISGKYSIMADSLIKVGGDHIKEAINHYIEGIKMDPKGENNYSVIPLLEKNANDNGDYLRIAKICSTGKLNIKGKEMDFLFREAEAYSKAGDYNKTAALYSSLDKYVTKDQIANWANKRKRKLLQIKQDITRIASLITFLNHRAIYYRKAGKHENSLKDISQAVALDVDETYFDIYFNFAKAVISAIKSKDNSCGYSKDDALSFLFKSASIALNKHDLATYKKLIQTIKGDPVLKPYFKAVKTYIKSSGNFI